MANQKGDLVETRTRFQKMIQQLGNPNAQKREQNSDWEHSHDAKYREECKKQREKLMNLGKHSKKEKRKSKKKEKRRHKKYKTSVSTDYDSSLSDSEESSSWSLGYSPTSNYERKKKRLKSKSGRKSHKKKEK